MAAMEPIHQELWKQVFLVWTTEGELELLSEYRWSFSNLEGAFKEGGVLHGKTVYLFTSTEPQLLRFGDVQWKLTHIPAVIAVVSPFPPSDKIGIASIQMGYEEILDMKDVNMDWVPYIPLGKRGCLDERTKPQIFMLSSCVQRGDGLKHLNPKKFEYCLPYVYNPSKEDESISLNIVYPPLEPNPVVTKFDWELDDLEKLTGLLIDEKKLTEDQKDAFKEHVEEKVEEAKRAIQLAKEKREDTCAEIIRAYEKMEFYKFYPVATPDTPDISIFKSPFINRYYGSAHHLF
ncbi:unnamed protein product [Lactuca virosa]|uniref:Uncharacterized protein n=1 Tax=Lactuca virosa TaxID=75947 RepID=A0AAU9PDV7_9ASTR|nr:unnamed protein product [Lactuca virosa]